MGAVEVNYIAETEAFIEFASHKGLSANERTLWYALFHLVNLEAKGRGWHDGFIPVPNKILLSLVPFTENTLPAVRNRLVQRGLIEYRPGKRKEMNPCYRMRFFRACKPPPVDKPVDKPVDNIVDNMDGTEWSGEESDLPPCNWGKSNSITDSINGGINSGINAYIRINNTERETETKQNDEEKDTASAILDMGARGQEKDFRDGRAEEAPIRMQVGANWAEAEALRRLRGIRETDWYRALYAGNRRTADALIDRSAYPAALVVEAMMRTRDRHGRDPLDCPVSYTVKVLEDWTRRGLKTAEDVCEHENGFYRARAK